MKNILSAFRMMIVMTLLLGLIYPLAMTGVAQSLLPEQAKGRLDLIGQKFSSQKYFWGRPSATDYSPLPSGGSNLSLTSQGLKDGIEARKLEWQRAHAKDFTQVPADLLFASGSGLDPHISPAAAEYQVRRVAEARQLSLDQVRALIQEATAPRQWGIFGEPTVNVVRLNISLDQLGAQE